MTPANALLKSAALALSVGLPAAGFVALAPVAVFAQALPAPYVSRALDAVLMPVDASVAQVFGLGGDATGVVVIATDPAGLAAAAGIEPGDVIDLVGGEAVVTPRELDAVVYYWITQGRYDFDLRANRGGAPFAAQTTVTLEIWESVIDVATVESWSSYSSESFSYSAYYSEYSEEISESYASSESLIEEDVASEEFTADMQAEDEGFAEAEAEAEGEAEGEAAAEDCDPSADPACAPEEEGAEGEAEAAEEEAAAADDAAADDSGDAGGDEGGGEEIVE